MKRTRENCSEATGAEIDNVMTLSVAEKVRSALSAGDHRARSNGRSRENKCSNGIPTAESRVGAMQPICYGNR